MHKCNWSSRTNFWGFEKKNYMLSMKNVLQAALNFLEVLMKYERIGTTQEKKLN